jgi:DNA-directed RNA polymerase specialized sigma24 family protein
MTASDRRNLSQPASIGAESASARRRQQEESLRQHGGELARLAAEGNQEKFFAQIVPQLGPLKQYIKRRLRIAYLDLQVRTHLYTSDDVLEEAVLRAYENFEKRPSNLSLEQWLYQIADGLLDRYISRQQRFETRQRSLESLEQAERRSLEEMPITTDAEGEVQAFVKIHWRN